MTNKERAIKLDSEGKCVVCETQVAGRRRGLCVTDYSRFRTVYLRVPAQDRDAFELMLVEKGRILESRQGQRGGADDDVFAEELSEFQRSREESESTQSAEATISEAKDIADRLAGNRKPLKKTRKPSK